MRLATSAATWLVKSQRAYEQLQGLVLDEDGDEELDLLLALLDEAATSNNHFLHLGCDPEVVIEVELSEPLDPSSLDNERLRVARRRAGDSRRQAMAEAVGFEGDLLKALDEVVAVWITQRAEEQVADFLDELVDVPVVASGWVSWRDAQLLDVRGPLAMAWWRQCPGPCPADDRMDIVASEAFDRALRADVGDSLRSVVEGLGDELDDFLRELALDRPEFRGLVSR